jgi:uncharacterized membrane protein YphA (DoxX/SURF4 family)
MITNTTKNEAARDYVLLCLRLAACTLFLGRGYLYISEIGPLSAFFWNQDWLGKPLEALTGMSWEAYSAHSEGFILAIQRSMGVLFLVAAVACWFVRGSGRKWANGIVLAAAFCLFLYSLLRWSDSDFQIAMLLEHFLQWGTPLLLVLFGRLDMSLWRLMAAILIACTFIGHGLYALGWGVPQNNEFVNMTTRILGVDRGGALIFLHLAGVLDFLAPILLCFSKLRIPAAAYLTLWGLLTALARIASYWTPAEDYYGMHPWMAETIVRLPHGLVPLALMLLFIMMRDSRLPKTIH